MVGKKERKGKGRGAKARKGWRGKGGGEGKTKGRWRHGAQHRIKRDNKPKQKEGAKECIDQGILRQARYILFVEKKHNPGLYLAR